MHIGSTQLAILRTLIGGPQSRRQTSRRIDRSEQLLQLALGRLDRHRPRLVVELADRLWLTAEGRAVVERSSHRMPVPSRRWQLGHRGLDVLDTLHHLPPDAALSTRELMDELGVSRAAAHTAALRLEGRRLVHRADSTLTRWRITRRGRTALRRALEQGRAPGVCRRAG